MLTRNTAGVLLTLLLSAARSGEPQPPPAMDGKESTRRLDVVVTGAQGIAIPGLGAADFEVREDGVRVPVVSATYRSVSRHSPTPVLPVSNRVAEAAAAHEPGTRVVLFYVDETNIRPGAESDRARAAVAEFIDEKHWERDLAVVVRPQDPVESIQFTRDETLLHGTLVSFNGRLGDGGSSPMPDVDAHLTALSRRLVGLGADRPVVVLVSGGWPGTRLGQGRASGLEALAQASSLSHAPIYVFDPSDPAEPATADAVALQQLASQTGGIAFRADRTIAGFARLFHDLHGYYAVTFQPAHADGRYHQLEVQVNRKAQVRAAAGYWAQGVTLSLHATVPAVTSPRVLRRSPLIDVWTGLRRDATGECRTILSWEPKTHGSDAPFRADVAVRTPEGRLVYRGTIRAAGDSSSAEHDLAVVPAGSGRVDVDLTTFSTAGRRLDSDVREVWVGTRCGSPAVQPALLPMEIVRARTAGELRTIVLTPTATPAAARVFARTDQLLVRVSAQDSSAAVARISAHLLNRAGGRIRELPAIAPADPARAQFLLPLASLATGPYAIEVVGQHRDATSTQRVSFTLQ